MMPLVNKMIFSRQLNNVSGYVITITTHGLCSQPEFQNTGRKSYQAHNIHHLNHNFMYFKNIR